MNKGFDIKTTEAILKRWANSLSGNQLLNQQQESLMLGCRHEFQEYNGFSESYRYCVKCDEKADL